MSEKPTVGRQVHYYPEKEYGDGPWAATVTRVLGDGKLTLWVLPPGSEPHEIRGASEGEEPGTWRWPAR